MSERTFVSRRGAGPTAELHNMSVPPRTVVTVARQPTRGRRYRVDLEKSLEDRLPGETLNSFTERVRRDGAACLLELVETAPAGEPVARLKELCESALNELRLPCGFGFFVEEPASRRGQTVSAAAAIAILAARSGPLYLPGRFEPSLITVRPLTLFFPSFAGTRDVDAGEEDLR